MTSNSEDINDLVSKYTQNPIYSTAKAIGDAYRALNDQENTNKYYQESIRLLRADFFVKPPSYEKNSLIYKTEKLLGDLTTIQVRAAKDLQTMATMDQVNALVSTVVSLVMASAKNYIPDPKERSEFTNSLASEIQKLVGASPARMIDASNSD